MLELSDIQSSQEELQDYYAQLSAQHITPAWIGGGISVEPQSKAVPYLWHWRDLRPQAMRAAELVGTQQAERRVLRLTNPKLSGAASNTLVANIQIVMPGEIAPAHRHSGLQRDQHPTGPRPIRQCFYRSATQLQRMKLRWRAGKSILRSIRDSFPPPRFVSRLDPLTAATQTARGRSDRPGPRSRPAERFEGNPAQIRSNREFRTLSFPPPSGRLPRAAALRPRPSPFAHRPSPICLPFSVFLPKSRTATAAIRSVW
jgi:hypothetical protein